MFKTIEEYILNIGNDLRECSLEDVDISKVDLRNILLPEDKNLFQKIKNKSLFKTMLPEKDYSKYNFNDVILTGTTFTSKSIIPIDNDFFQLINKKDLFETTLPDIQFSKYNFDDIKIAKTKFSKTSIFDAKYDFFQRINNKNIYRTVLPEADYSLYDFNGVQMIGCNFQEKSELPLVIDLFQKIYDKSLLDVKLPTSVLNRIFLYDLSEVEVDWQKYNLDIYTLIQLYEKYKQNKKMIFPEIDISLRTKKEISI